MINVRILAREYGDKQQSLTVQEFKSQFSNLKGSWAIFSKDTAIPQEEAYKRVNLSDIKDGMSLQVIPQLAGG